VERHVTNSRRPQAFRTGSHALASIDLTIDDGDFLAILGRSGKWQVDFAAVIAGWRSLTSGNRRMVPRATASRARTPCRLPAAVLMPWLTAGENVVFAGRFAANRQSFQLEYAQELFAALRLEPGG